jgi:phage shock protein PspC (stress-responsive transcriptional regulator)
MVRGDIMSKLYRSRENKMIAGVCGGLAEYFQIDVSLVRLVWILMVVAAGSGVFLYILAWIIVPERDGGEETFASPSEKSSNLLGVILIGAGVVLLMDRIFPWKNIVKFWPIALIVIGVLMITGWRGSK